jgi:hypothetical protein
MVFTKGMEVFGMSIVCEIKVLTLFLDPFLDQGIQFVTLAWNSGDRYFSPQAELFTVHHLHTLNNWI